MSWQMVDDTDFQPDWLSPPGATIVDVLKERGISAERLARSLARSREDVQDLFEGRMMITIDLARRLEEVLGASVEFWMARELQYRADARRIEAEAHDWLRELPVSDMIRFGWLTPAPRPSDEVDR